MIRYVMSCCVVLYHVAVCHVTLCYIMLYHVMLFMLCYVVLCYGQSAQTFYMCLESLVGCMKENFGSFTYFSADGTILRSFAKYFWADGVFEDV